jgi:hypothetical protein
VALVSVTASFAVAVVLVVLWAMPGGADAQEPNAAAEVEASVDPAVEQMMALELADALGVGSGDTAEGSGVMAPAEGSAEVPPAPVAPPRSQGETRAAALGQHVLDHARRLTPSAADPRLDTLRAGDVTDVAFAELLGLAVGDLANPELVRAARTTSEAEVARLEAALRTQTAATTEAFARSNQLQREPVAEDAAAPTIVLQGAQASAAVVFALQTQQQRDATRSALALERARLRALERRVSTLEAAAAAAAETTTTDAEQLAETITAGRERLARESEATSEVEARAAEAQARARAEREQARDAQERQLATEWEKLGPALERIVTERRIEEARLAEQTQSAEGLAAIQVDIGAELTSILQLDPDDRGPRADAFVDGLIARRAEARVTLVDAHEERIERRSVVSTQRTAVADARRAIDEVETRQTTPELRSRWRELREEQLRISEERLALEALRAETAETRWRLLETEINYYARTIDRLIPDLTAERRAELVRLTPENLREARRNMAERVVAFGVVWSDRVRGRAAMSAVAPGGRGGWMAWGQPLLIVLLFFGARRTLAQWRGPVVARIVALRELPSLRRYTRAIVKLAEVIHVTAPQILWGLAIAAVRASIPNRLAELDFVFATAFWIVGYQGAAATARVILLPRRDREVVEIAIDGEQTRLGIDLFGWPTDRARLVQRTVRICLLYFVAGRVGLATVRALLGPGFFFYYASLLFQIGLWVVIYLLGWYWRRDIVQRFCESTKETSAFEAWLSERQDKPYIVLVVVFLVAYLAGKWALRVGAEWAAGRGPGQRVANFFFKRRIERANTAAQSAISSSAPLPVAYRRVFRDVPLDGDPYLVQRPTGEADLEAALEAWRLDGVRGTVAVVGDPGAGKTTFLNVARTMGTAPLSPTSAARPGGRSADDAQAEDDATGSTPEGPELAWTRLEPTERVVGVPALLAWLSPLVEASVESRSALVEALCNGPKRLVQVDRCELLLLRCVGGFDAIDAFFDIVTLTNHRVFWLLSFDRFAWQYLHRVRDRRGYFRSVLYLRPLTADQLRDAIERRNEAVGVHPLFDRLVGAQNDSQMLEEVRTSAGYFRLLAEASGGNLRVAQHLWLRSLVRESDEQLHVHLFDRADDTLLKRLSDELLFALTAIVQHAGMTNAEIALAINADPLTCEVYLNHLTELGVLEPCGGGRVRLTVAYYVAAIARLRDENLLHLDMR